MILIIKVKEYLIKMELVLDESTDPMRNCFHKIFTYPLSSGRRYTVTDERYLDSERSYRGKRSNRIHLPITIPGSKEYQFAVYVPRPSEMKGSFRECALFENLFPEGYTRWKFVSHRRSSEGILNRLGLEWIRERKIQTKIEGGEIVELFSGDRLVYDLPDRSLILRFEESSTE